MTDINETLPYWMVKIRKDSTIHMAELLNKNNVDLTKEQWVVLRISNQGKLMQTDLAEAIYRNKPSMSIIFNRTKSKYDLGQLTSIDFR
ncbi:MAG: hypothetical protein HRT66_02790 [Flavobacteriaceae bacterium]|nr:hypothetical protein [Flavobacteriaceae bacterium]